MLPAIFLHGLEKDMLGAKSTDLGSFGYLASSDLFCLAFRVSWKIWICSLLKVQKAWEKWASIATGQQLTVLCKRGRNTPGCGSFLHLLASPQIHAHASLIYISCLASGFFKLLRCDPRHSEVGHYSVKSKRG